MIRTKKIRCQSICFCAFNSLEPHIRIDRDLKFPRSVDPFRSQFQLYVGFHPKAEPLPSYTLRHSLRVPWHWKMFTPSSFAFSLTIASKLPVHPILERILLSTNLEIQWSNSYLIRRYGLFTAYLMTNKTKNKEIRKVKVEHNWFPGIYNWLIPTTVALINNVFGGKVCMVRNQELSLEFWSMSLLW